MHINIGIESNVFVLEAIKAITLPFAILASVASTIPKILF
jgi:hypothetical protein